MNEIIQIKCPFDGAVLSVKNQPGIESKSVTCPICKHKYPFTQFKKVTMRNEDDEPGTDFVGSGAFSKDVKKEPFPEINFTLGRIKVIGVGQAYQLKIGKNIIGRKAKQSTSDFMIDTGSNRMMSREHIIIEVKNVPGKGLVHYLSLFKDKVNPTFIGNEPLYFGDCIVLNDKTTIRMPGADLLFESPDEDETEF